MIGEKSFLLKKKTLNAEVVGRSEHCVNETAASMVIAA